MNPSRTIFLCLVVLLTAGCDRPGSSNYFPLTEGLSWEYLIEYRVREEKKTQKLVFSSRPPVEVEEGIFYPRVSLNGHRDYYQKTDAGIVHVDPVSGDRTMILAHPVKKGRTWQADSSIRILKVTGAFAATFNKKVTEPITVDYEIAETDETIEVKAGKFENCIRVEGKGRLFAGRTLQDYMGIDSIYIEETEWYAPGTGLVKTVRTEYTEPNEFKNTYSQELMEVARR